MHLHQSNGNHREQILVEDCEECDGTGTNDSKPVDGAYKVSSMAGEAMERTSACYCQARKDEDGVLIPPSTMLRNLID